MYGIYYSNVYFPFWRAGEQKNHYLIGSSLTSAVLNSWTCSLMQHTQFPPFSAHAEITNQGEKSLKTEHWQLLCLAPKLVQGVPQLRASPVSLCETDPSSLLFQMTSLPLTEQRLLSLRFPSRKDLSTEAIQLALSNPMCLPSLLSMTCLRGSMWCQTWVLLPCHFLQDR